MNTHVILKSSEEVTFPWNKTKVKIMEITHTILDVEVSEWMDSFGQSYFSIDELKAGLAAHSVYILVGVALRQSYRAYEFSTIECSQVIQMWYNNKHIETHFWTRGVN